ncbi:MAG: M20/M25/M40 family metallo-hydrolase [Synergistaceae bacterium]|nr:M20/M25/M40 family metallo-hydrolase [Synergistaceae bacterium]
MIDSERLLKTFLEYVTIDSETLSELEMALRLTSDLAAIGCEVWRDNAGAAIGSNGYNIYAKLAGVGEPFLFSAHMDTVKPGNGVKPIVRDGVITSSGDTVLGSDDKSGLAGIIEALRTVTEKKIPHRAAEIIFTIAEEGGLNGVKNADLSSLISKEGVVLDCVADVGSIIISAPGQARLTAVITGRSSHAGAEPEKGVSAIQAACDGISAMKLLRIDAETTANIGTFKSEFATNIVPEKALVIGEARSRNDGKLNAQIGHMKKCFEDACLKYGATLELQVDTQYLSYSFEQDDQLVRKISDACRKIGQKPVFEASGGGSDANIMNRKGIKTVVVSTGMDKVHTTSERITVKNLEDTARLCIALMTDLPAQ